MLERVLHGVGYLIAPFLFFRADTPAAVVRRLRFAYRLVGVTIEATATEDDTERTEFLCPYRNLAAGRYGEKWVCHRKLDRVDDGYVTYLRRHKGIDYRRPRGCEETGECDPEYCFSEVSKVSEASAVSAVSEVSGVSEGSNVSNASSASEGSEGSERS